MSYNLTRRVLRAEKKQFVREWKKKNNVTDDKLGKILKLRNKYFSLNNQYDLIVELALNALKKNAEPLLKEVSE